MSFTLRWSAKALDRPADFWWEAPERQVILDAIDRIDDLLRFDPEAKGESRADQERILLEYPLGVLYQIDRTASAVDMLNVWRFDRRHK